MRWHLSVLPTLVLARSANDAGGLDIHSVNAASAASYAQTECKEAATAAQSAEMQGSTYRSVRIQGGGKERVI